MAGSGGTPTRPPLRRVFLAIIVFKYVKLAAFVVAGIVVLRTARLSDESPAARTARFLGAHPRGSRRTPERPGTFAFLSRADPARKEVAGAACILIGLVFGAEGTLLALRVWWATDFTFALTALGVAIELVEIARRPGHLRLYVLLVVNLAILAYIWTRRNEFLLEGERQA